MAVAVVAAGAAAVAFLVLLLFLELRLQSADFSLQDRVLRMATKLMKKMISLITRSTRISVFLYIRRRLLCKFLFSTSTSTFSTFPLYARALISYGSMVSLPISMKL